MEASTGKRWRDATVVVIGSGPSLTVEDCTLVERWRSGQGWTSLVALWQAPIMAAIVINTSYQRAPWADVLYACDDTWWDSIALGIRIAEFNQLNQSAQFEHLAKAKAKLAEMFHGELWTQNEVAANRYGLNYIKSERKEGLSKTPGVIHQGSNSGFQAINLAQQWGAKRIILLGFDMSDDGSKTHWHKPHNATKSPYERWIEMFRILAIDLKAEGVSVVNCTRRTALNCFPLSKLEDELARTVLAA